MNSPPELAEDRPPGDPVNSHPPLWKRDFVPYLLASILAVAMLVYAEVRAFVWDEGFHLVAAQLIDAGKKPYIDFCFPQPPLNAYWNAGWMQLFGQSWRVPHLFAALLTIATVFLVTHFLLSRLSGMAWRLPCVIAGMLSVALSVTVVEFGAISQAYAMCLFTTFAAFRLAIVAIHRRTFWLALGAGMLAGAAAASSLLSAPVALVLLVWIIVRNQAASRWLKGVAFLVGAVIPFAPVIWLFSQAPYQVFFNIVTYQALFRRVNWGDAVSHDIDVLSSWVDSGQTLFLFFLTLAGLWFVSKKSGWSLRIRREFYLCGWLAASLVAYISTAHPTFNRYFVICIPFLAVLAAPGVFAVGSRLVSPTRPFWPAVTVALIFAIALGRDLFNGRDGGSWQRYGKIADKVSQVTSRHARLFADEPVYFLLRWTPPSGMEFSYSHKLELPADQETKLHIISQKELQAQVKKGVYATLETCDDDRIDDWSLDKIYKQRADLEDCTVFWDFNPAAKIPDPAAKIPDKKEKSEK